MILALNRKLNQSDKKVKKFDFTVDDLVGFNLQNKIVGIIGTGKIGAAVVKILHGFECKILVYDIVKNNSLQEDF
jgi:D-lactate dehydrogenase